MLQPTRTPVAANDLEIPYQRINEILNKKYQDIETRFSNQPLTRPENWGGYSIEPIRIEFLEFKPTRFHDRKLYELINGHWTIKLLQP